ncbi:MAG: hypothetical protein HFH08_01210 [Bacilli bacterium]|nr:hypothetical protein [Bacilli bacterium]
MLTYEQFMNLVPKETATFVSKVLPYLDGYLRDDVKLRFKGDYQSDHKDSKTNYLLLYCLSDRKEYATFLKRYGFDIEKYKINTDWVNLNVNSELLFEKFSQVFNIYDDQTLYASLTPLDIVQKAFKQCISNCGSYIFDYLFPHISLNTFLEELEKLRQAEKIENEHQLEQETYGELSISVISYLETASKIRTLLYSILRKDHELIKLNDEDIVPISLLLALYYYKDMPLREEEIPEQKLLQTMLQEKGVNLDKITNAIGQSFYVNTVRDTIKNVDAIRLLYSKYYYSGVNEKVEEAEITVSKIFSNLFDRNFTNSYAIEKLFAKLNCYVGVFLPLEEKVEKLRDSEERINSLSYVKNFYAELSKESRDFIEFTTKTYLLLLEKMKEKTHNEEILVDEDDADTLALFIASYYYKLDVSEFFEDYGISLESVLELLNLKIAKEEIDAMKLNQKVLVDRYKRFVYEGVNRNKSAKTIRITDIAHNLCNREFNRSMIMENIFFELAKSTDLQSDFLEQLRIHLEKKEQKRKMDLTQRLFKDMPVSTMEYLENASIIHQFLLGHIKQYSEMDIQVLSLLLSAIISTKSDIANFLNSKNLTLNGVCNFLSVSPNYLMKGTINIDILAEQYGMFIFGGCNKDLGRKDITIFNIIRNIFSKDVYNSVLISKFLGNFGLSYEDFENLEEKFATYLEETEEDKKIEEAKGILNSFREKAKQYIINVMRIHQRLVRVAYQDESVARLIPNITDVRELSLLLGMFTIENDVQYFFEKNKVTLEHICSLIGLDTDIIKGLEGEEINYKLILETYRPWIQYGSSNYNRTVSDLISRIFDKSIGKESLILEEIVSFVGSNYDILKEEVESKKDHEVSLSIDDRIKLLSEESIDVLDLTDVKSILHFGNSLSIHSKYIHDELPRLMMSDAHDKSVEAIRHIVDKIYTGVPVEKKKRSLFERIFGVMVEEEPKLVLNPDAIQELKEAIDSNIESLSKELLGYDAIRRYIEAYRKKNRSHLLVAISETEKVEEEVKGLAPDKEEEYAAFLLATSRLQIMRDKTNRFSTSNHLMKQELLKVNQAIVNHFITINALEMAKDDLLPLIGAELALTQGRNTENKSLDLSENVIGLFQSLLSRNVAGAVENMEKLKQSSLSADTFALLNRDIEVYLKGLNQVAQLEGKVESLDIDQVVITSDYKPKLVLTGQEDSIDQKNKQMVLEYPKE